METVSRVQKSILNARVSVLFYFLALVPAFYSRRIFLQSLGAEFIGLTGTIGNLLNFLNLAEMGVGTAVGFMLYRPLFEKDSNKIIEIVSVLGYLYRRIGLAIVCVGILLSFFLPLVFPASGFQMSVIFFAYYSFLISSLIGYFINYREILLSADQRYYVIAAYFQTAGIIKVLVQMIFAYHTHNYYIWIFIELLFGILQCIILNWKINRVYPWLRTNPKAGKELYKNYSEIGRKTRQLFVQTIADYSLYSTRDLIIYAFTSLSMVAYYGNYMAIIMKLNQLIVSMLTGLQASVGNLIAENNTEKTIRIFWEIMALRYFCSSVFIFALYHLIGPFVTLWLGGEYILKNNILLLILCNIFIMQVRNIPINFIQGYGLFGDVVAPVTEAVLNLSFSIFLGHYYGLPGVLTGPIISLFIIGYIWKPFYLFRNGFKRPVKHYWMEISKYLSLIFISWWLVSYLMSISRFINPYQSFSRLVVYALFLVTVYSIVLGLMMYLLKGTRDIVKRLAIKFHFQ